jgi:hypothetical protein
MTLYKSMSNMNARYLEEAIKLEKKWAKNPEFLKMIQEANRGRPAIVMESQRLAGEAPKPPGDPESP